MRFAHDLLAGDQLFRLAALFVEHHRRKHPQRLAGFLERTPVRIDARQLL